MKKGSTAQSILLTAMLLASGSASAGTCSSLIFSSGFEAAETTGPVNLATVPAAGAMNVELENIISATFSEKMATDSVNNSTFLLSQGGNGVSGTVILDSANNRAKLGTDKTLALLRDYTATLTDCITNLSGTSLQSTSWNFTSRDGAWDAVAKQLGPGKAGLASAPQIAANANGNAMTVWMEDAGGRSEIWAKRYEPGNGWRNPELIETDPVFSSANPQVAMDDAGNAMVVWQRADGIFADSIWARRYVAGAGWDTAEALEAAAGGAHQQRIAVNAAGDAIAVWTQTDEFDTPGIWANRYVADSGWSGPELIVWVTDTFAQDPQVAINDAGVAFAVWSQQDDSADGVTHIWAGRYIPNSGWNSAQLIESETIEFAFLPQVFVDAAGEATVVWMQEDDTVDFFTHIWANRYGEVTSFRDYYYTGVNFSVESGSRFSATDSLSGYFRLDCAAAGGSGDCKSLPSSDYAAAVTDCSFTASGSPDLTITCADALGSGFVLETNADANLAGYYNITFESSLEGGNGARIVMNSSGGFTVARPGAIGGEGRVNYTAGSWFRGTTLSWGVPELLETDEFSYAEGPRISGDSNGNVMAIWQQDDEFTTSPPTGDPIYNLWANRYTSGGDWSGPELVETGSDADAFNPEIAVDDLGNAIAAWETNDFDSSMFSASRYIPGSGWSDPVKVGEISAANPLDLTITSRTPLAADGYGNIHVVWQRQLGDPQDGIYANRFGGGGEPNGSLISETLFADDALGNCVRAAASANSWHFAQEATALDCSNRGIQSVIGLETFVNLVSLNLSGNPIDDLSVITRFPDLRELRLSNIPTLTDIRALLEQGQLTTIDLSGSGDGKISCPDLDALGGAVTRPAICRKSIAEVSFADSVLQTCVANSMTEQMVTFIDELTILNCERRDGARDIGQIQQLEGIQILQNLEVINIDRSVVDDLSPLTGMLKLKRIDASSTYVETLDAIAALPNLEVLVLNTVPKLYNDIDSGQDPTGISILASMPALKEVYLGEKDYCAAGNGPQCWTGNGRLDCATLDSMDGMFDVYVRPASCNMPLADALAEVPDLALRACLQTQATNDGLTDTQGFALFDACYNGGVTDLSGMENFSRIVHLDLRLNPITDLSPLNNIRTLQVLFLNNTSITSFDALTNLNLLRKIEARNIPGLTDITELLRMTRLGKYSSQTGDFGYVALWDSGGGNIACDALALLEDIITANGANGDTGAICGGPPVIPPTEGRLVDLDGDNADDLIFQFDAGEGVPLTSNWTTALGKAPLFDEFSNLPGYDTTLYSRARAIALADANNDGIDDLLLQLDSATDDNIFLQVQLNDGTGQFTTSTTPLLIPDGALNNAQAVAFKDVNQDGYADILIQWQETFSISLSVYDLFLGNGSSFASVGVNPFFAFFDVAKKGRPRIIALEDVNNDSYPDLVYVTESITIESNEFYKFCFSVMPWDPIGGHFKGSGTGSNCTELKPPPRVFLESASVADLTGNGNKELVLSFNKEMNLERIGDEGHFVAMMTLIDDRGTAKWSGLNTMIGEYSSTTPGVVTNFRTVAVADINNDRRADVIIEREVEGSGKSWITYLADTDANGYLAYTRDATRIPTPARSEEYMAIGLLDYDDTDLQNLPDLLFRRMNTVSGMKEIRVAVNNGDFFGNSALWYSNPEIPGIIGLEEDGLTALANDTSELLAWSGDTRLQTRGQFSEWLRLERGMELLSKTVLDLDPNVGANKCVLGYADAQAGGGESVDGFNQYHASAKMAVLACNYQVGDVISLKMQAVYGGCAGTAGVAGIGGKCEAGLFKEEATFTISESPPLSVDAELNGPKASACAEVTLTNFCAGAEASLADASVGGNIGGVGASTGVSAGGIGGRLQAGWEDGAITASVGVELLVGVEFELSVNPEEVGETFILVGETSFTWGRKGANAVGDGGEFVIFTAGPAVYKAASSAASGAAGVAKTVAGDAVKFFGNTANDAEQVFVIFVFLGDGFIDEIFAELSNMAEALANGTFDSYVSGTLYSAGEKFLSAASRLYNYLF